MSEITGKNGRKVISIGGKKFGVRDRSVFVTVMVSVGEDSPLVGKQKCSLVEGVVGLEEISEIT